MNWGNLEPATFLSSSVRKKFSQLVEHKLDSIISDKFSHVVNDDFVIDWNEFDRVVFSLHIEAPSESEICSIIIKSAKLHPLYDKICRSSHKYFVILNICIFIESCLAILLEFSPAPLLRVMLFDERLNSILSSSEIDVLRYLLSPTGLNIRNIILHGFFDSILFSSDIILLMVCLFQTLRFKMKKIGENNTPTRVMDMNFSPIDILSTPMLNLERIPTFPILQPSFPYFVEASKDLNQLNFVSSLLKILPVVEHLLRVLFVLSNSIAYPDKDFIISYLQANENCYFSTLDGFGQRAKHQLLLHPHIFSYSSSNRFSLDDSDELQDSNIRNQLIDTLGVSLYGLLVDLFFTERGPNLRSKLFHEHVYVSNYEIINTDIAILLENGVISSAFTRSFDQNFDSYAHILCYVCQQLYITIADISDRNLINLLNSSPSLCSCLDSRSPCVNFPGGYESKFSASSMLKKASLELLDCNRNFFEFFLTRLNRITVIQEDSLSMGVYNITFDSVCLRVEDTNGKISSQHINKAPWMDHNMAIDANVKCLGSIGRHLLSLIRHCHGIERLSRLEDRIRIRLMEYLRIDSSRQLPLINCLIEIMQRLIALSNSLTISVIALEKTFQSGTSHTTDRKRYILIVGGLWEVVQEFTSLFFHSWMAYLLSNIDDSEANSISSSNKPNFNSTKASSSLFATAFSKMLTMLSMLCNSIPCSCSASTSDSSSEQCYSNFLSERRKNLQDTLSFLLQSLQKPYFRDMNPCW